jgi:CBS domain containing-hemolysin-like protein
MAETGPWLLLSLFLVVFLALSAFFSGSETAFFSLSRIQIGRMRESKDPVSVKILRVLATPHRLLTSTLLGNTLVNVATATVTTAVLIGLSRRWGIELAIVIGTALVLVFGEILPKTLAVSHPVGFSRIVVRPMEAFMSVAAPVAGLATALTKRLLRVLGIKNTSLKLGFLTGGELRTLFDQLEKEKVMSELETRMARNIFSFSTTAVESVMTPRVDVVAVSDSASVEEAVGLIKESRHSRVPVYSGSIDNTTGFISAKEFLLAPERPISPRFVRPVIIVPENKRVDETFHEMQSRRCPLVVVVNEYGETMGIVTLEDLVEEIVGEIYDEYEASEVPLVKVGENEYIVEGLISLEDLNRELDLSLNAEDSVTLNGLICESLDRLPAPADRIRLGQVTALVLETDGHRCTRCRITLERAEEQG